MSCKNCDPLHNKPGRLIKVTPDFKRCAVCGDKIDRSLYGDFDGLTISNSGWDTYFHSICQTVSSKSPCLSRQIGAVLVRDHSIVSTGYNGPPREIPHCQDQCPRRKYGYPSGTHMEICPAQHAEQNAVSNAARLGVSVVGTALYMNSIIPCKNCYGTLINAGIVEIVIEEVTIYDKYTQFLIDNSSIRIRSFNH